MIQKNIILSLVAENVKKLKVVRIQPAGPVVVVGGNNAQGKTSVLDSIAAAMLGKKSMDEQFLREGQKKGYIEIKLTDIIIRRTFNDNGGGTLTVSDNNGKKYGSPQELLNSVVGKISFDPLDFSRLKSSEQIEIIKNITGVNFDVLDSQRKLIFEDRTLVNREIKTLEGKLSGLKFNNDVPEKKLSLVELNKKLIRNYNTAPSVVFNARR